jgi:hypothetical protein
MADDVITILDHDVQVEFQGNDPARPLDPPDLLRRLTAMADAINAKTSLWTDAQRKAFTGITRIVLFRGLVEVGGVAMGRPGCDLPNAIFYWQADEFLQVDHAGVRANTFFHDCWHLVQYAKSGYPRTVEEGVDREVDAVDRQIEVARVLECYDADLEFLTDYEHDRPAIRARLDQGIHTHVADILQA